MKKNIVMLLLLSFLIGSPVISKEGADTFSIIPEPVSVLEKSGYFRFSMKSNLYSNLEPGDVKIIADALNDHLKLFYGWEFKNIKHSDKFSKKGIFIKLNKDLKLGEEGYRIEVTKKGILLEAQALNGLFYAVQTLIQMMPAKPSGLSEISIKHCTIEDYPRFKWRGLHLDVCRHFMSKDFVLKYIDLLAKHKMNTFHFHLTEDQGWRIEIKKYPLLTQVGSVRKETIVGNGRTSVQFDGTPHSGFYTQDDIKEIVAYASKRFVTVVPEIEMPGHSLAALASYPFLGCTGGTYEVATKWGVFHDVMCAGKESTFEFIQNVLDEIISLFPSQYIHIGGDECPKTKWKECPLCQKRIKDEGLTDEHHLQSYFIQRVEKYLNKKGRKLIGWDEILEGGLAPNAAVMSWRGEEGGIAAAKQSHFVVMTPGSHCYLDHYQGKPESEPLAIGGFTPLEKIYSYEPVPAVLNEMEAAFILGAQGNVWTEYMPDSSHVEYMVYPRAAALAEVVWSPKGKRDYSSFFERLKKQLIRYDQYNVNYSKSSLNR
ncbi:MAG: beta-N-acetylhexosaminidase [Bacteroidales bacterium]